MAQIMIDTDSEPIAGLMLLSRLLTDYANMRMVSDKAAKATYPAITFFKSPDVDTNKQVELYAAAARETGMVPELAANFGTPDTVVEPDPTKLFGKFAVPTGTQQNPNNVVPLFPPSGVLGVTPGAPMTAPSVPQAPTIPLPSALPVMTTGAAGSILPSVTTATAPTVPTNVHSAPVAPVTGLSAVVELDSAGLPWDARIHSSSKKTKGDGTWKIARGLPEGLAQSVTAELMAAKIATPTTSVTAHVPAVAITVATAPVPVAPNPPVILPPASGVPVPPSTTGVPVAPIPGQQGNVPPHVPTPPLTPGAAPVAPVNPVTRFREMMAKISAGLGSKAFTQAQVTEAHKSPGIQLEQLQQAVLFPDKIPLIEAALGLS